MSRNTITIAVANQKGGVGKTTTAITIGHGLALAGYNTCLMDTDPQGHIALGLGLEKAPGLFNLLVNNSDLSACAIDTGRRNLSAVLSDKSTERANRYLTTASFSEGAIQQAVQFAQYDIILIDLAPSLNTIHVAALLAADICLIPVKLDHLALDGVNEVLKSIAEINRHGGNIQEVAIIPTFFERTTNETREQFRALYQVHADRLWLPIPADVKVREAPAYGKTLFEYAPKSAAVLGYEEASQHLGGYAAAVRRLENLIGGRS